MIPNRIALFWSALRLSAWLALMAGVLSAVAPDALAQPFGPTIRIPIAKVAEPYVNPAEDGNGGCCGVRLYGEWPAYLNLTNRSSYTIYTPGLQSSASPQNSVSPGERFRFYCYFVGCCGPGDYCLGNCETEIGGDLPDWYVEVQRRGPTASFTSRQLPPVPGQFEFKSTSTDPEGEVLREEWSFGDNSSGDGASPIHLYTLPGDFSVRLTVTDPDSLTNATTRTVVVPAPPLSVSLGVFSKHENNRIEPGEEFRVEVTVSAGSEGVGDLAAVAFAGTPLVVPSNLTLVEAPPNTDIGTLAPGGKKTFTWKLRGGGIGDFVLETADLSGTDAAGRPVSGPGDAEQGSVTALIVGIQQRPARVVLGEDNNGDGVVNAADARVELVIGVTNVAAVEITELRTDDVAEPIDLVTRLANEPVALDPVGLFSGDLGSVLPGAANAVFRTNVYTATNYVYANASTIVRGKIDGTPAQGGASATVEVRQPGVKITMHALEQSGLDPGSIDEGRQQIDAPLIPSTAGAALRIQPEVHSGLVGDGVTPLLFKLEADTKALSVQEDPLKIRVEARIRGQGRLGGPALQTRVRVLKNGAWTSTDTAQMTRSESEVYVYVTPIASDDIQPAEGTGFVLAELEVVNADSGTSLERLEFGLRKPPITLVHGYNTDGNWGAEALNILKASRPDDSRAGPFVHVIRYGQDVDGTDLVSRTVSASVNTTWPLEDLVFQVHEQFQKAMEPMKREWAFTRHDVVAHSQGGLLTRMLCAANPNHVMRQAFRNEENFFRGWFHRVVTIGSPHNGTRILRYMLTLDEGDSAVSPAVPSLVSALMVTKRVAQKKFDPWGPEIVNLNNQHSSAPWYPDQGARFHLVRTTVNYGLPPTLVFATVAERALNLTSTVLPRGSDGVVDFDSMGAHGPDGAAGENVFTLPKDINVSHATISAGPIDDIFGGTDGGQVNAIAVAHHVIGALDQVGIPAQARVFGSMRPPPPLSFAIRDAIDESALTTQAQFLADGFAAIDSPQGNREVRQGDGATTFALRLTPSANRPLGAEKVYWFAEVFGTNGVSVDGLTLESDPVQPTLATLQVAEGVLGDVVAYAFYPVAGGGNVYSLPLRVASFEPPTPAEELQVLPQGTSLPVGDRAPAQVFVRHADGLWIQRYVQSSELTVTSDAPLIVDVSDPLKWRCQSSGKALVSAAWRGLTSTGAVSVFGYRDGSLPVPEPLVWLRADAGVNLTNGNSVVSWTDQSRSNFVFAPPSAATRPIWVPATNGRPATVRFSGGASPHVIGNLGRTLTNATIFTLGRFLDTGGGTRYIYSFGTRNFSGLQLTLGRQGGDGAFHYDGAASWLADNAIPGTNFLVFSQVVGEDSPDQHRLMVGAREVLVNRTTVGRAYSAVATNVYVGRYPGSGAFGGELVEWLIYDRVLRAEERLAVEEYLRQRAGLAPFFAPGSLDLTGTSRLDYDSSELPAATWASDLGNRSARLAGAADPAFLLAPEGPAGPVIQARLRSNGDHGFIGFVLGWTDAGNFLLFDWNRAATNHPAHGYAAAGMRLRSFHVDGGQAPTAVDFWSSPDPVRVTPNISADTPWVPGVDYDLTIRPLADRLELTVMQATNVVVSWSLPQLPGVEGRFGFYAFDAGGAEFGQLVVPDAPLFVTGLEAAGGSEVTLRWMNGKQPYVIEGSTSLAPGEWFEIVPSTPNQSQRIELNDNTMFFRVRGAGN